MEDIVIINIPTEHADADFQAWAVQNQAFFAETCARQLLVCTKNMYLNLPQEKRIAFETLKGKGQPWIYNGDNAFKFMLEVYCGLRSTTPKDYNITGQIRDSWRAYGAATKPVAILNTFMQNLFHDGKILKSQLVDPFFKSEDLYAVLAEKLGLNKSQTVLVIADTFGTTKDVCTGIGKDNSKRAHSIILTHSSEQERRDRAMELLDEKAAKRIVVDIKPKAFSDAIDDITTADVVIVCSPMCSDEFLAKNKKDNFHQLPEEIRIEESIMNAWMLRKEKSLTDHGRLVQIRGVPQARGATSQEWQDFIDMLADDSIITFADLQVELRQRQVQNKLVIEQTRLFIDSSVAVRKKGQRINGINIVVDNDNFVKATLQLSRPNTNHQLSADVAP